jgi:hypothetical protein
MIYKVGDMVVTKYTRTVCKVTAASDILLSGVQRLELTCRAEILIRDSDMVERYEKTEQMGLSLIEIRQLAQHNANQTGRPLCIINCKSWGYQLMEVQKAKGRKVLETIYPEKQKEVQNDGQI